MNVRSFVYAAVIGGLGFGVLEMRARNVKSAPHVTKVILRPCLKTENVGPVHPGHHIIIQVLGCRLPGYECKVISYDKDILVYKGNSYQDLSGNDTLGFFGLHEFHFVAAHTGIAHIDLVRKTANEPEGKQWKVTVGIVPLCPQYPLT